jgi:hypothetical protein
MTAVVLDGRRFRRADPSGVLAAADDRSLASFDAWRLRPGT